MSMVLHEIVQCGFSSLTWIGKINNILQNTSVATLCTKNGRGKGRKPDVPKILNRIEQREIGEERHLGRPLRVQGNHRISKRWERVPLG